VCHIASSSSHRQQIRIFILHSVPPLPSEYKTTLSSRSITLMPRKGHGSLIFLRKEDLASTLHSHNHNLTDSMSWARAGGEGPEIGSGKRCHSCLAFTFPFFFVCWWWEEEEKKKEKVRKRLKITAGRETADSARICPSRATDGRNRWEAYGDGEDISHNATPRPAQCPRCTGRVTPPPSPPFRQRISNDVQANIREGIMNPLKQGVI